MPDLEHQIKAYAEHLDAVTPWVDDLAARPSERRKVDRFVPASSRWRTGAVVAGAVAALIVVVVGGLALLTRTESEVAAPSTTPTTTAAPARLRFLPATDAPAFTTGSEGAWDFPFVGPGAVVVADGVFHMYRNGYGDGLPTGVGYGVSPDGLTWAPAGAEPLFVLDGMSAAQVHSGIVTADGTWMLFFDGAVGEGDEKSHKVIGRATAPGPEGPWALDPNPVLEPASGWNEVSVEQPSVLRTAEGFVMYFVGIDADEVARIGRAVSSDGVTWAADPAPVLAATEEWERGNVKRPEVVVTDDGWAMLYANRSAGNWGIATSRDGVTWSKFVNNPVLTTTDVPRAVIRNAELVLVDGTYYLYLENGGDRSSRDIAILWRDRPIPIS